MITERKNAVAGVLDAVFGLALTGAGHERIACGCGGSIEVWRFGPEHSEAGCVFAGHYRSDAAELWDSRLAMPAAGSPDTDRAAIARWLTDTHDQIDAGREVGR